MTDIRKELEILRFYYKGLDKKIKEGIHLTKTNGNCFEWEIMGSIIKKLMKEVEM